VAGHFAGDGAALGSQLLQACNQGEPFKQQRAARPFLRLTVAQDTPQATVFETPSTFSRSRRPIQGAALFCSSSMAGFRRRA